MVGPARQHFQTHTGTKTSVLLVQKWDDELCPEVDDYPIFFAVSAKAARDNSGDYVYAKNDNGQYKLDRNGHLIVDHDLHNHDGELTDGITEAFIQWAKEEGLSFWRNGEDGSEAERRKAWRRFVATNRRRKYKLIMISTSLIYATKSTTWKAI